MFLKPLFKFAVPALRTAKTNVLGVCEGPCCVQIMCFTCSFSVS